MTGAVRQGRPDAWPMSLVSVDPSTGYVKAMVGGRDFASNQVNLALGGSTGMQPGSSMKPYTMAAALEQGITPDTVLPRDQRLAGPRLRAAPKDENCVDRR